MEATKEQKIECLEEAIFQYEQGAIGGICLMIIRYMRKHKIKVTTAQEFIPELRLIRPHNWHLNLLWFGSTNKDNARTRRNKCVELLEIIKSRK